MLWITHITSRAHLTRSWIPTPSAYNQTQRQVTQLTARPPPNAFATISCADCNMLLLFSWLSARASFHASPAPVSPTRMPPVRLVAGASDSRRVVDVVSPYLSLSLSCREWRGIKRSEVPGCIGAIILSATLLADNLALSTIVSLGAAGVMGSEASALLALC